jgi:hypothetical protein
MSHNDITGDKIATDVPSDAYRENWDRIFGKKPIPTTIADMVEQEKDKDDDAIAANLAGN